MFRTVSCAGVGLAVLMAAQHTASADTSATWAQNLATFPAIGGKGPVAPNLTVDLTGVKDVPTTPTPLLVAQLPPPSPPPGGPGIAATAAPTTCTGPVDPYKNYACLDAYLGDGFLAPL